MNGEVIFLTILAMMSLTALIWFYMYARRIPAMREVGVSAQTYTTPDKVTEFLPEEINYWANNLKSLFELTVLFYGLCLYLFVSGNVGAGYVVAAWLFFVFRTLHSIAHCSSNVVMRRFYLYAAAALALWFMLGRALIGALAA